MRIPSFALHYKEESRNGRNV